MNNYGIKNLMGTLLAIWESHLPKNLRGALLAICDLGSSFCAKLKSGHCFRFEIWDVYLSSNLRGTLLAI